MRPLPKQSFFICTLSLCQLPLPSCGTCQLWLDAASFYRDPFYFGMYLWQPCSFRAYAWNTSGNTSSFCPVVHAPVHDYAKRRFLWKLLCSSWCLVCKEGTASVTCTGRFGKPFLSKCNVHRSFPLLQCQYGIISSTCRRLPYRTGIKPYRNWFQIFPFFTGTKWMDLFLPLLFHPFVYLDHSL